MLFRQLSACVPTIVNPFLCYRGTCHSSSLRDDRLGHIEQLFDPSRARAGRDGTRHDTMIITWYCGTYDVPVLGASNMHMPNIRGRSWDLYALSNVKSCASANRIVIPDMYAAC